MRNIQVIACHDVLYGLLWLWVVLTIIPLSLVSYLLIEKPGMRLGEILTRFARS